MHSSAVPTAAVLDGLTTEGTGHSQGLGRYCASCDDKGSGVASNSSSGQVGELATPIRGVQGHSEETLFVLGGAHTHERIACAVRR